MRTSLVVLLAVTVTMGCGGVQVEPAAAPEPVAPVVDPVAVPEPEPDPNAGLLWYVYWQGIHNLTVYPTPGLVRSEEPHNAVPAFLSRNPYFSIISVYYEHEDVWAPAIEAATSVEDLLDRFRAMENVEVEEAVNPVQLETY